MSPTRRRLTHSLAERTPPDPRRKRRIFCSEVTGFHVEISPKGKRTWYFQFIRDGKRSRIRLGDIGVLDFADARTAALDLRKKIDAGEDPAAEWQAKLAERDKPPQSSVEDLWALYLERHSRPHKAPRSVADDEALYRRNVRPVIGKVAIADVTPEHIRKIVSDVGDRAPVQANRTRALLSKMMNCAEQWGLRPMGSNPCRHAPRYKERARERFLSDAEIRRLFDALEAHEKAGDIPWQATKAIRLLLLTGMRRGEALALRWESVDLQRNVAMIEQGKTGRRAVLLSTGAVELLEALPSRVSSEWVFPHGKRGKASHFTGIDEPWRLIRDEAKLSGVRIHDLRHSAASLLAASGASLPIIGAVLGHRTPQMTQRYSHLAAAPLRAAVEELNKAVNAAREKESAEVLEVGGKNP